MVYELEDTSKAKGLFEGWQETLITSCLQKVMGKIFVTDLSEPASAFAFVGCFGFFAGKPDPELVKSKPEGFALLTPQNRDWAELIKAAFLRDGRGVVVVKNGEIVSGASSYTRYREGIEIEVDTVEEERRKHLALIACSALILRCLDEGLYPSWDAQNMASVRLAEKLGYQFDHEYTAYEVT